MEAQQAQHSQKMLELAQSPRHRGAFFHQDAQERGLALVESKHRDTKIYLLVDPDTDIVRATRFFAYGGTFSLAVGEAVCTMAENKNIQALRALTPVQVERFLRDREDEPALEDLNHPSLAAVYTLVSQAVDAYPQAKTLAQVQQSVADKPDPRKFAGLSPDDGEWMKLPKPEQIGRIESLLDSDIRPGLNMDGGDLTILDLEDGHRLKVQYQGACGGCASSTGATLSFIEDKLRQQLFAGIQVLPE